MATAPTTIPTKVGLTFVDWYTDPAPTASSTPFQFTTPITSNTILYAGWKATVMFNTHIATKPVFIGSTIARPKNPTRTGFVFVDWYKDSALTKAFDFDAETITKDTPIYAGWAPTWSMIAAGENHTVAIKTDGTLWAWGSNSSGQLGLGNKTDKDVPTQVVGATWKAVSAGETHTAGIKADGTLWAWGKNDKGQLGLGNKTDKDVPTQVAAGATWKAVAAGRAHTVGIQADGILWAWGENSDGQLGTTTTSHKTRPTKVGSATWSTVATRRHHTAGIKADGTLWAWGSNWAGQLGLGNKTNQNSPTQETSGATNWSTVAVGGYHTAGIKADGTLYAWGNNPFGQLGLGNKDAKAIPVQVVGATWKAIAAGVNYTVGIKADDTLHAWGKNDKGQLGNGESGADKEKTSPVQIGMATWKAIAAGGYPTAGIKADDTLFAWGNNDHGQLGLGNKTNQTSPTLVMEAPTTP